ncbi:class I adenylate-forming enzyme family protein [Salinigranum salinum]|uniref:class I adenylate-forming enzyme family protein n=1 Tax=Salinigranum salinum TaxID=1364937 RepID=UPI001864AB6C|nr:class I adenylate-forming enzyme family protein [Salinigranum salinum]
MPHDRATERNLGAVHDPVAASDPDRTALVDGETDERLSYGGFATRVARVANVLADLGVGRDDRVLAFSPNDVRYLVTLLAVARLGAVPVPINLQLRREKLSAIVDDSGASLAVVRPGPSVPDAVDAVLDDAAGVETVVVDGSPEACSLSETRVVALTERLPAAADERAPVAVSADDPAIQPYTSGSTGRPKGVVLTHGGVSWCTTAFTDHLDLDADDRGLVVTPLYHKNAMTGVVKPMLHRGGTVVLVPEFDSAAVVAAIDTYDVTYMTGVPAIYKRLVADASALDAHDVSSMTWASCGSAPVPASLVDSFSETFDADLLEVYGLTEGGPVVTHSPRTGSRKVGSAGVALPGVETEIVDPETGETCPPGEPGELLVASPGLGRYHDRPAATRAAFELRDGRRVLHTGDLVRKDAAGYHYVVGRLDDMLVVGGENLYPAEVEDLLLTHDAVEDVAVVAVPHAEKGEAPVAFVVRATPVSEAELKGYALDRGPAYAHPRRVFFAAELPLGGTGKIQTSKLRSIARARVDGEL